MSMEPIRRLDRARGSLPIDAVLRVERPAREEDKPDERRGQQDDRPDGTPDADGHVDVRA